MKVAYQEFDLSGCMRYPLASRPSKVRQAGLRGTATCRGRAWRHSWSGCRQGVAAAEFTAVIEAIVAAHDAHPDHLGWAHVIGGAVAVLIEALIKRPGFRRSC